MSIEFTFTPWVNWPGKEELSGLEAPGLYVVTKTPENIEGQAFMWLKDILYIGESKSLRKRLKTFNRVLKNKKGKHCGALKMVKEHPDYEKLMPKLYVSILAVGEDIAKNNPDGWQRRGDARQLEYYSIAEYMKRYQDTPQYNN